MLISCKIPYQDNKKAQKLLPFSDKENFGSWIINNRVSDEFDTEIIDEEK
ncbi:hypothetical protein [Polaribacter sp. KT25b]|nr:hypothetical protein [Polaribacter sp. KT25b]